MTRVGTFEAKTHLTRLLAQVAQGEKVLITNRGKPVAMLVPPESEKHEDVKALVAEMLRVRDREGPTIGKGRTIRDMIEEGRRF